jgi:hypothetical protein
MPVDQGHLPCIDRGELRAVRLCSRLRIPCEEFEAWIASSTVRVDRRVVAVPPPAPPPVRGSFRRLFDGGSAS